MKNNNSKIWRIISVIVLIGGILVGIALAYGAMDQKVRYNSVEVEKTALKAENNEKVIIEMGADIKYIKIAVNEIRLEIKNERK